MDSSASTDSVRELEVRWLRDGMNHAGLSNQALAAKLAACGWSGSINNVSNWRSGLAAIPDSVVPLLVRVFGRDPHTDGLGEVTHFLARRSPWLRPFLRDVTPGELAQTELTTANGSEPVYYGRRGNYQGKRFVLYRDSAGRYVGGRDRYEAQKQVFDSKDDLIRAMKSDPELRVRMVPEEMPSTPPSLIHQESIVWE